MIWLISTFPSFTRTWQSLMLNMTITCRVHFIVVLASLLALQFASQDSTLLDMLWHNSWWYGTYRAWIHHQWPRASLLWTRLDCQLSTYTLACNTSFGMFMLKSNTLNTTPNSLRKDCTFFDTLIVPHNGSNKSRFLQGQITDVDLLVT